MVHPILMATPHALSIWYLMSFVKVCAFLNHLYLYELIIEGIECEMICIGNAPYVRGCSGCGGCAGSVGHVHPRYHTFSHSQKRPMRPRWT